MLQVTTAQIASYIFYPIQFFIQSKKGDDRENQKYVSKQHTYRAERILGMAGHHRNRCPNATLGFIDGKTKHAIIRHKIG